MVDLDLHPCACADHSSHHHDATSTSRPASPSRDITNVRAPQDDVIETVDASNDERVLRAITLSLDDKDSDEKGMVMLPSPSLASEDPSPPPSLWDRMREAPGKGKAKLKKAGDLMVRHSRFAGPGLVCSVAYFDPGNWSVDLSAGSSYGYKLLFVVLCAGLGAAFLQVMSLRVGIITGTSLAAQIRQLALRLREKHPRFRKPIMGMLYLIYVMAEIAIIATDLAELLGSAIALNLLFPKIPLYAGVLITAADVFVVLIFFQRPDGGRKGMMAFEVLIVGMVLCVFICFVILIVQVKPDWVQVFEGFLPSKTVFGPKALYTSVGIIGATVMPHGLFLGSHLATIDRLDTAPRPPPESLRSSNSSASSATERSRKTIVPRRWQAHLDRGLDILRLDRIGWARRRCSGDAAIEMAAGGATHKSAGGVPQSKLAMAELAYERDLSTFDKITWAKVHIAHATVDIVASLLGFAVTINSAILVVAAAAFYYGADAAVQAAAANADLFSAYELIKTQIAPGAATIFALALLCSGQSASITATLAGQVVSEGFIEWKTSPLVRRLITRLIGIIPSAVVAVAVGRKGIDTMLVASQVALSIVLPFVIFPLVWIASDKGVMTLSNPLGVLTAAAEAKAQRPVGEQTPEECDFSAHWITKTIGYMLFSVITVANAYVIVTLAMGG